MQDGRHQQIERAQKKQDRIETSVAAIACLMFIALFATLAGCANTWQHPTKTTEDGQRDAYECEREAAPVLDPMRNSAMRERCLRLRGWRPAQ